MKRRNLVKIGTPGLSGSGRQAQTIVEYTILIAAIAAVTCIGTAVFFQRVCRTQDGGNSILRNYFNRVAAIVGF